MFSKLLNYSQIPNDIIVVFIVDWKIQSNNSIINLWKTSVVDDFNNWFKEALTYKEYNPRTINFLEWPTWNGKYINQTFFPLIIILLIISLFWYFFWNHHIKKWFMYFWVWTIVFFWIFFDFFSITNQVKIYSDIKSASNIMVNWRVWKQSDFYDFLEFIKTQVPYKEKWIFIAPYPFDFEWKYHIYPDVKFEEINKVKYLFWYNPYWEKSPFGFKDPIYESWALLYNSWSYSVE